MLRRTLFTLSTALKSQRVVLPLFFLIFALFCVMWLTLPEGTGRAQTISAQETQSPTDKAVNLTPENPIDATQQLQPDAQFDVGVIPDAPGRCPSGSEYVTIYMDDEDKNNASSLSGWTGAIRHRVTNHVNGTEFGFCRVDGRRLFNLGHMNLINWESLPHDPNKATVGSYTYTVLKLGSACPNGSKEIFYTIDNENKNNQNGSTGNIAPSISSRSQQGKTYWRFCMFTPSSGSPSMSKFPSFGNTPYSVLAGRFTPPSGAGHYNYWQDRGIVDTDDEDTHNTNTLSAPTFSTNDDYFDLGATINSGSNTRFYVAKVFYRQMRCDQPVAWWDGTFITAGFDSRNCFVRAAPQGSSPFVWTDKYYIRPTPSQNCPIGGYDGANCYVMPTPPGAFIYNNAFYVIPGPGNSCPAGSTFDGANCYFMSAPWGTFAFIYQGGFYTTTLPYCIDGGFDSVNCYLGTAPAGTTPFIYANNFYYAE